MASVHAMLPAPAGQANSGLPVFSHTKGGRIYSLKVEQQPVRARMCGFGDKDRRPITPPPCIRLIVLDAATKKEVDFNEVDGTFFLLNVDLWSADGQQEVNLVRHSSGSPAVSISTATTTSFPPPPERATFSGEAPMAIYRDVHGRPMVAPAPQMGPYTPYIPPQSFPQQGYYPPVPGTPVHPATPYGNSFAPPQVGVPSPMGVNPMNPINGMQQGFPPQGPMPPGMMMPQNMMALPPAPASGMFTRNLIGSLAVNAFKLNDVEGKVGFWFVLQDLSVRTEGSFRLKMNFVDVGSGVANQLNKGTAPVLASVYSDIFTVFSAKKFPGVIESTPLSRCFAAQGIKIPIRKDGPKTLSNQAEYDADD
ncbi:hypothetical protein B0A49_04274 [Cryomyces minteri]|uniref:Velvet domain-containing protein n=1 Tax=Cryomyces minteri TaxID=331657 RepID=A0A4U0XH51_9PEZI|nr:hypothetical protein B0A49_04274 [Cryomyces minteri]